MVFEALVVELLNKFLKQYVENLDTSQLKLGIWGGDVVLKELKIRTTLFDELNLPVRVKWGTLGKLAMKIPWKNLYGSQVVIDIQELLMVVVPNSEFKYDPVKEEKWQQDRKQAKLKAIEEAKKREMESEDTKQSDSFLEKLLTQIIKNLQIIIRNIHIRYEDKTTIPGAPFSVGVTMSNFSAQTTVNDPSAPLTKLTASNENFICKVVNLEGLSIYWNSLSVLFSELPPDELAKVLLESIPNADYKPDGFLYVFGPMSASAFLRLNSKPENDGCNFTIPKVFVNVHLKEIELAVTHNQFCDAAMFLQEFRRLSAATKYRKYRPVNTPVIGNAKVWWLFAYMGIVEDIIRRKREWSWQNIIEHRMMCRRYSELFKLKLNSKKISAETGNELCDLENKLNLFNLILIREQVYVEVERSNLKKTETSNQGWFSGWFGFGSEPRPDSSDDELVKKLESVMTVNEKQKLYKAIGYEESAPPTNYPPAFVELQFWFHLGEIKMTVFDDQPAQLTPIMTLSVKSVRMEIEQRPSAFAMKFVMIVGNFKVTGKEDRDRTYPELVTSNCTEDESLIEILYETKPLSASCDQLINVNARPLRIIYHAETINLVREVFTTGVSDEMTKFVAATSASLPTFQKITALGLQYAIEKRTILVVKVNIMSSYLIIPYGGLYDSEKDMLVIVFGKLTVETTENEQKDVSVRKMFLQGTSDAEIFSTVLSASYTNFRCTLTGVQILFQLRDEDWVHASTVKGPSPLRFLESTNLVVTIKKSLVTDDARIPKIVVEGNLPSLTFNFSEERLVSLAALICSVPSKTAEATTMSKKAVSASAWSLQSIGTQLESKLANFQKDLGYAKHDDYVQGIDFVGHFHMNELVVNISKNKDPASELTPKSKEVQFLNLKVVRMDVEMTSKTFEKIYLLKLGGIEFKQYCDKSKLPFVMPKAVELDYYLFVMEYINLDTKVPDFYTKRQAIINRLTMNVAPLNFVLNREALLAQLEFVHTVQRRLNTVKENCPKDRLGDAGKVKDIIHEDVTEGHHPDKKIITKGKRFRKKRAQKEVIDFFLVASLNEIDVVVEEEGKGIAEFSLVGGSLEMSTRKSYTTVDLKLQKISVVDLSPMTFHKKIVESLEKQTLLSRSTFYNSEYFGSEKKLDMSIDAELGGLRCTFLHAFFSRLFAFLNAFQVQVKSLKEGATIAAQKAKENFMKAYKNDAQICINIKITAPLLVIPRNSESLEALVVDLGVLKIKNSITELDCGSDSESTNRPIIDTMCFHLQNLNVSRCTFSGDLHKTQINCENERAFLVPVSFELTLKRNLSTAWFKVLPHLEVLARLAAVHVTLSHDDLCTITSTLRENIDEGILYGEQRRQTIHEDSGRPGTRRDKAEKHKILEEEGHQAAEKPAGDSECGISTVVKFTFFMDSFVFDAINETVDQELGSTGLARFVLEMISIKGRQLSDGSINSTLMLVSCLLEDRRPGKAGRITRLMERRADTTGESNSEMNAINSMVEVMYQKNGLDDFVDVRVYKFTLILSMDFLQKLGEFFTVAGQKGVEMATKKEGLKAIEKRLMGKDGQERPPTFTLNLRLEKPDIAIVESMDSIDTDALVFHTEIILKYRMAGARQVISGTLTDIESYSCCFNPEKRLHTMCQVVKPFTICVAGSTPKDHGLHLDICVTEISITINPRTVQLVSKCCEVLLYRSPVNNENLDEKVYSDLWDVKPFNPDDYWFFRLEEGVDVVSTFSSKSYTSIVDRSVVEEVCLMAVPSIVVTLEGKLTKRSKPLLLLEMGFQMQCYNWSTKMTIENSLTIKMDYYNNVLSSWEPLIEPVEKILENRKHNYVPWELNCSMNFGDEGDLEDLQPPKLGIILSSTEMLQLLVTKTSLEVLKSAAETYTSAVTKGVVTKELDLPPYIIKNDTGLAVELLLEESGLQVCKDIANAYKIVKLESNSEVELQNVESDHSGFVRSMSLGQLKKEARSLLYVKFPISNENVYELPLGMSSKRYYPVTLDRFDKGEVWGLVSEVLIHDNTTSVVLRSILNVVNYFSEPINVHILSDDGREAEFIGTVEGNSRFCLPFHAIYNSNKQLFFSVNGYSLSIQSFSWEEIKKEENVSALLQCNSKVPENGDPFFIQVVGETEQIYYNNTKYKTTASMCYNIHLQPTIKIFNSLPVPLVICFQGRAVEKILQPGNNLQITNAEPGVSTITLRIASYLEKEWSCKEKLAQNPPEFFIWKFDSYNGLTPETLNLGVHCTYKRKTAVYTVYCPYFMVNKTDHLLSYKFDGSSTVFYHPPDYHLPVMFSPSFRKFFGKKSAYLQVKQSAWSDKFPVDVAGSGGTVECEDADLKYKISVTISLTHNSLTRIVVFTPFYVFMNEAKFALECQESEFLEEPWLEIPVNSCIPFWPRSQEKSRTMKIRPKGSAVVTADFRYESTDSCLLRLAHKCGGIFVNVQATQAGTYITLNSYEPGQAPVLIINHSAKVIKLFEEKPHYSITLKPLRQVFHSWMSPTGKRKLIWLNPKRQKQALVIDQDKDGLVFTERGEPVRYVSFLDGDQRVLVFTEDVQLSASDIRSRMVRSGIEVICKIHGIGLSLVNNLSNVEIFYAAFVSSGILWEAKKRDRLRFKAMPKQDMYDVENAYIKYENECEMKNEVDPVVDINEKLKVNFEAMEVIKPNWRKLRRTFEPGVWLAYRLMNEQIMLHLKINKIQVDNQLLGCVFPVLLSPIPPPKTVASLSQAPRPFFELSIMKIASDRSRVEQFKYFKLLVQEFSVKIDIGIIQQLWDFLAREDISDEEEKLYFKRDMELTQKPLIAYVEVVSSTEQKNFYDLLHFTPLKIHFSFSLAGNIGTKSLPASFSVMLQSLGMTLTDVHDVIFRLSYFERKGVFLTKRKLIKEVISHYYGQVVRQAYVLLLGLDVIGNPYGLIVGIGEGVEAFFYEPVQGIIQGPSDFATGVAIGCRSLVGRTVGSTAGTLGKLTETLGKGLAVLSLDKEYQVQRMEAQNQQENIQASMARGGRGLVMGVFDGVTGIVRKPLEGAKEEGVGGFFKGMGKGMMGLVTKPVSGVVDFASTSLNAVKRAAEAGPDNRRIRPPRFFRDDALVEPYNLYDAEGNAIFYSICKRKYCGTDKYEYHAELKGNEIVVLTNKRIILAKLSEVFGTWQEHLAVTWRSMPDRPHCHTKGIAMTMPRKSEQKKKEKPDIKILLVENPIIREEMCKKMIELYQLENEPQS